MIRQLLSSCIRMASDKSMEKIKINAELAKNTIRELKNEINLLNETYNIVKAQQLREENAQLLKAVEEAKKNLTQLEIRNGIQQVNISDSSNTVCPKNEPEKKPADMVHIKNQIKKEKPQKEKKCKETKEKAPGVEEAIDFGRLDFRIAQVLDVQRHPDADSLYVLKINCGEENPRTVCSGLVKHVPIEELQNRKVMLLCNLKPVKMRGITSEAMVMCASTSEKVEVLTPPFESIAGDLVHCDGYDRKPDNVMNPKKKIFETVAPDLHTNENVLACYKNIPLNVPGKGNICANTLKNCPVK